MLSIKDTPLNEINIHTTALSVILSLSFYLIFILPRVVSWIIPVTSPNISIATKTIVRKLTCKGGVVSGMGFFVSDRVLHMILSVRGADFGNYN